MTMVTRAPWRLASMAARPAIPPPPRTRTSALAVEIVMSRSCDVEASALPCQSALRLHGAARPPDHQGRRQDLLQRLAREPFRVPDDLQNPFGRQSSHLRLLLGHGGELDLPVAGDRD